MKLEWTVLNDFITNLIWRSSLPISSSSFGFEKAKMRENRVNNKKVFFILIKKSWRWVEKLITYKSEMRKINLLLLT